MSQGRPRRCDSEGVDAIMNGQGGLRLGATRLLLGLIVVVGLTGCATPPQGRVPVPTWPVPPEPLPDPTSGPLSPEFGPATWALDPQYPVPMETTTELHVLVWERACSSGSPATGRMSTPVVEFASASVTITIGVRPLQVEPGSGVTCPMPPGTPASLRLGEPLGSRTLLDGGRVPPAPPSPANG